VALNAAEARGRAGKDAGYHFRIALGSVRETAMILDVAEAEGTIEPTALAASRELLDRLGAMLWRLGR
jgi:four helix bundle protein